MLTTPDQALNEDITALLRATDAGFLGHPSPRACPREPTVAGRCGATGVS